DRGPVEAEILPGFRGLGHDQALAHQLRGAPQRRVGPFDRFDRGHYSVAHGDGLSDIEIADLARDREREVEVLELRLAQLGSRGKPGACERVRDQRDRVDYRNSLGFHFARDSAQHGIVTEPADAREHLERARIGRKRIFEARARNPSGHRGLIHAATLEHFYYALEFADFYPGDFVDVFFQRGVGFVQVRDRNDADAMAAGARRDLDGEDSVARDDTEFTHARGRQPRAGNSR